MSDKPKLTMSPDEVSQVEARVRRAMTRFVMDLEELYEVLCAEEEDGLPVTEGLTDLLQEELRWRQEALRDLRVYAVPPDGVVVDTAGSDAIDDCLHTPAVRRQLPPRN